MGKWTEHEEGEWSLLVILVVTVVLAVGVLLASAAGIAPGCHPRHPGECPILDSTTTTITVPVETPGHS